MGGGKSSKVHRKGHKIDELKHHSRQHKKSKSPKKKRDRRNSSSGSSSETSGHGNKFEELLAAKRLEKIEQKKFEKKRQKELETPEQKRARRQAKKLQKVFRDFDYLCQISRKGVRKISRKMKTIY